MNQQERSRVVARVYAEWSAELAGKVSLSEHAKGGRSQSAEGEEILGADAAAHTELKRRTDAALEAAGLTVEFTPASTADKHERLRQLAGKRVSSRWPGYSQPEDYDGYDFKDLVSPFTRSAGNVDATVMLFLQDWASQDSMKGDFHAESARLGHNPARITNVRLEELLRRHLNLRLDETYATNLFPFIKPGGMSATIPARDLRQAALEFGLPQVEIVNPRIVVALGRNVSNALDGAGIEHHVVRHPAARISTVDREDEWARLSAALGVRS